MIQIFFTVAGALFSAAALSLFLFGTIYNLVDSIKARRNRRYLVPVENKDLDNVHGGKTPVDGPHKYW